MNETAFMSIIACLQHAKDNQNSSLKMDSVILTQRGKTFRHDFHEAVRPNDIRSLSKTVVSLAVGTAIHLGVKLDGKQITEDLEIWPYFESWINLENRANIPFLRKLRLRHLLNLTTGFDQGLLFSKDLQNRALDNLLEYVFNFEIVHDPGTYFVYSNAGPYILSALIQETLGKSLAEWVNDLIFAPLGIARFEWRKYGKYCIGSSGLILDIEDVHKITTLLMNDGRFDKKQLVPKPWIEKMRSPISLTPKMYDEKRVFPKYAYGYGLWICKDGNYYCDGTDGQYLIVLPKHHIGITTFGHQSDMKPITECFRHLL
jgi:CubicO group peptidase (beta-lactamase class C family)